MFDLIIVKQGNQEVLRDLRDIKLDRVLKTVAEQAARVNALDIEIEFALRKHSPLVPKV